MEQKQQALEEATKHLLDTGAAGVGAWGVANIIGLINLYVPPLLLVLALLWWGVRYWEGLSGKKISDTKLAKFITRRKD